MASLEPLFLFQNALSPLGSTFSLILFSVLGMIGSYIGVFHSFDVMQDKLRAMRDMEDTFDFIIVGAGSAGSVLANRLSESYKVLVLEAGGESNPLHSIPVLSLFLLNYPHIDWQYFTTPQKRACFAMNNNQCAWPRGKALGGSSNLNLMIYVRGHPKDFDNWANITGDPRWSWEGVLPYFKKSEDYAGEWDYPRFHSHGGDLKVQEPPYTGMADIFTRAGMEMGYPRTDMNAEFTEGFSPIYYTTNKGRRYGTYKAFLEPVRDRPNLFIYKFSHVSQILFDGPRNRAIGVEYIRHGVTRRAFATKEVIISAGSMNSPQILMLSGIGPKEHLDELGIQVRVNLPVGKNLNDHIATFLGPFLVDRPISMKMERDVTAEAVDDFTKRGTGPLTSTGVQATAFVRTKFAHQSQHPDWPDIQYLLLGTGLYGRQDKEFSRALNLRPGVMSKFYGQGAKEKDSFQVLNMLCRPNSRGRITLQGRDPLLPPLFDPDYYADERDMKTVVEGAKIAVNIMENAPIMRSMNVRLHHVPMPGCENVPFRSDAYWECYHRHYSLTVYHQSGTCAMGRPGSPTAVVDSEMRVLGTENLRVIDASIMPAVTSGNTNAPTVMIGEKGADYIKATWAGSNQI